MKSLQLTYKELKLSRLRAVKNDLCKFAAYL